MRAIFVTWVVAVGRQGHGYTGFIPKGLVTRVRIFQYLHGVAGWLLGIWIAAVMSIFELNTSSGSLLHSTCLIVAEVDLHQKST